MASGAESLQLFNQLVANANSLFLSNDDSVVINGITKPTLKKIYADFLASMGTYPTIADGLAATSGTGTSNRFFTVPATGDLFETRYRNDGGVAVEISSILSWLVDGLTINRGKVFPCRVATRNGVTSAQNTALNQFVLGATVVGAEPDYYYRIGYYVNGYTGLTGADPDGWIIERIAKANYATADNPVTQIIRYTDVAPVITAGLQTITLKSASFPEVKFVLTVDGSKRPARGTPIAANASFNQGYSYYIDPSVYLELDPRDSLTINVGKVAPFKQVSRGGYLSPANTTMLNAILDARVLNAKTGMYYGLKYFQNGSTSAAPEGDNWIIEEAPISSYGSSTAVESVNQIATLQEVKQPVLDRTIGVQTVTLATKTDVRILLTIDPSKLPAYGTPVGMSSPGLSGFSHVIDPALYVLKSDKGGALSYIIDMAGRLQVSWRDPDGVARGYTFGINGANNLPNFFNLRKGNSIVHQFGTDMLPPMVIDAAQNGDVSPPLDFTGGNHTINGKQTAVNVGFDILADGRLVKAGESGRATNLVCRIYNRLMACNTVESERYVGLQAFVVSFFPGGAQVEAEFTAMEDLQLYIDYGPQLVHINLEQTVFFIGGQFAAPVPYVTGLGSGKPSEYPDAWAVLCTGADGQLGAWIDRNYGIAGAENTSDDFDLMTGSGAGSTSRKQYPTAYHRRLDRDPVNPNYLPLAAGKSYKWRGGYSWQPVAPKSPFVASMDYMLDGRVRRVDAISASRTVSPDAETEGKRLKSIEARLAEIEANP